MSRVVGIGGIFIKAMDPTALWAWYREHLHMEIEDWGGMVFKWNRPDGPGRQGTTVWSIFDRDSNYFAPSAAPFMANYIVIDPSAVLAGLRSEACTVADKNRRIRVRQIRLGYGSGG